MKRKIYVVGPQKGYMNWMEGELVDDMKTADLVVFTGGEDVTPTIYNETPHPRTGNNIHRDHYELKEFKEALSYKKPMIGICRGLKKTCGPL